MNIMVFDVPASNGGALTVLDEWYEKCIKDHKNNYFFVLSTIELEEKENIKILMFPWIKKGWLYRLYFDNFIAPKLIKKYQIDKVISLQNLIIPHTNVTQTLLVHNALPFTEYRFSLLKDTRLWIYQNILSKGIIKSIKNAEKVYVQTEWMKKAVIKESQIKDSKIDVIPSNTKVNVKRFFESDKESISTFFYPASYFSYKNHQIIVEASLLLKDKYNHRIVFTLKGNESKDIKRLYRKVKEYNIPIEFAGSLSQADVFDYYSKSILLFPSFIETFGLPLLESRLHKGIILASDTPFANEILKDYNNAYFFNYSDPMVLASLMKKLLTSEIKYQPYK